MRAHAATPGGREIVLTDEVLGPWRARLADPPARPARWCVAAAHVVWKESYRALGHSLDAPGDPDEIGAHVDWDATMALRRRLDALGFGVAEAMDTAQRFAIGWPNARRLVRATGELGLANGFVAGAGADHLEPGSITRPAQLVDAVVEQAQVIQAAGGIAILLPLPWLAQTGQSEATYVDVYGAIVRQLDGPLLVHWLGEMFLPALRGYFPGRSFQRVMELDPAVVRGCKLSLLDADLERRVRAELLERDQVVLTGDDLHFAGLIEGESQGGEPPAIQRTTSIGGRDVPLGAFSHALLGVLDAVAAPMSVALALLAQGDLASWRAVASPCEELGRWLFQPPTERYKAGLAFLAWLNGLQQNALLANREELARDREHGLRAAELAAAAGAIADASLAAARLQELAREPG